MTLPTIRDRVKNSISNTPGTGSGYTLSTAVSGFQSFSDAYGADATVDILVTEGTSWEVASNAAYTHSGTTLSRGTLEDSSTGSAINFTSAAVVSVVNLSKRMNNANNASAGFIVGMDLVYQDSVTIRVNSGRVEINGKIYSFSQTDYDLDASGATQAKQIDGTTITSLTTNWQASECYYVYAYLNSGAVEIRFERATLHASSTNDGPPTWDDELRYWKAPTTGATARRIGKFYVDSSNAIIKFWYSNIERYSTMYVANVATLILLNAGTNTDYTSAITITPYVQVDDLRLMIGLEATRTSAGTAAITVTLSWDAGTTYFASMQYADNTSSTGAVRLRPIIIPRGGTSLTYAVSGTNGASTILLLGSEFTR